MLMILVMSSLPNICINVYSLSAYMHNIDIQYISTIFSTTTSLMQFFTACWFGNEVTLDVCTYECLFLFIDGVLGMVETHFTLFLRVNESELPFMKWIGLHLKYLPRNFC